MEHETISAGQVASHLTGPNFESSSTTVRGKRCKKGSRAAYVLSDVASLLRSDPARHRIWVQDCDRHRRLLVGILTGDAEFARVCDEHSGLLGRMALFFQILLPGMIDPLARAALTWIHGYISQNAASLRAGFVGDTSGCTDEAISWLVFASRLEALLRQHAIVNTPGRMYGIPYVLPLQVAVSTALSQEFQKVGFSAWAKQAMLIAQQHTDDNDHPLPANTIVKTRFSQVSPSDDFRTVDIACLCSAPAEGQSPQMKHYHSQIVLSSLQSGGAVGKLRSLKIKTEGSNIKCLGMGVGGYGNNQFFNSRFAPQCRSTVDGVPTDVAEAIAMRHYDRVSLCVLAVILIRQSVSRRDVDACASQYKQLGYHHLAPIHRAIWDQCHSLSTDGVLLSTVCRHLQSVTLVCPMMETIRTYSKCSLSDTSGSRYSDDLTCFMEKSSMFHDNE
jgi:hypothetical protein